MGWFLVHLLHLIIAFKIIISFLTSPEYFMNNNEMTCAEFGFLVTDHQLNGWLEFVRGRTKPKER